MPVLIDDMDRLQEYVTGMMTRAEHHARNVDEIVSTIAGALVWKADELKVRTQSGEMKNAIWVKIGGDKYYLSFNHEAQRVEIRSTNAIGQVLASFDDGSSVADIRTFFEKL